MLSEIELGPRRFAAEGSPARLRAWSGLHDVMRQANRPDLVLSGVNRGNNSAENALYSGTLGGAMEAALQGLPGLCPLAVLWVRRTVDLDDPFEGAAAAWRRPVVRKVFKARLRRIPRRGLRALLQRELSARARPPSVKGTRVTAAGLPRATPAIRVEPHLSPSGKRFLWIKRRRAARPHPARQQRCRRRTSKATYLGGADAGRPDRARHALDALRSILE